ncbi:MAG: hypothetical protein QM781_19040 [Chitinophagaceae bacterium]
MTNLENYFGISVKIDKELDPYRITILKERANKIAELAQFDITKFFVYIHHISISQVNGDHFASKVPLQNRFDKIIVWFKVNEKQRRKGSIMFFNDHADLPAHKDVIYENGKDEIKRTYPVSMLGSDSIDTELITFINRSLVRNRNRKIKVTIAPNPTLEFLYMLEKAKKETIISSIDLAFEDRVRLNMVKLIPHKAIKSHKAFRKLKSPIEDMVSVTIDSKEETDKKIAELPVIVILTAILEEYQAVRDHLVNVVEADVDDTDYEKGIFEMDGSKIASVIIRECGARNVNVAQETERAISNFSPKVIMFTGIAGSRKPKDFQIGDVVFAEKIYYYEGGKSEKEAFKARPDMAVATFVLSEIAKKERRKENWKLLLKNEFSKDIKADLGVIASGEQIVEHYESGIGKILTDHYNDTSAVEMEGFGFAKAVARQGRGKGNILVGIVRGISDIIEQSEDINAQNSNGNINKRPAEMKKFASATAAAFTFWLIYKLFKKK